MTVASTFDFFFQVTNALNLTIYQKLLTKRKLRIIV